MCKLLRKLCDFYNVNQTRIDRIIRKALFYITSIVACLIVFQLGLKLIPLFKSSFSVETTNNLNMVLLSLALSYIAGFIIYLFINYFPEKSKQRSFMKMINPRIDIIVNDSFVYIAYLAKLYKNSDNYLSLGLHDFSNIQYLKNNKMGFSYRISNIENQTHSTGEFTEFAYYELIREYSIKTIDDFFKLPPSLYMPDDLIVILSKIRDCGLFQHPDAKSIPIPIQNFDRQLFEYYGALLKLMKYSSSFNVITDSSINYSYHQNGTMITIPHTIKEKKPDIVI